MNGTYVDLTLRCVGEPKSQPKWMHNDSVVDEAWDTILNTAVGRLKTVMMTRVDVTERFTGRYQCVDAAFFQSDSDVLTIHAGTIQTSPHFSLIAHSSSAISAPLLMRINRAIVTKLVS